MFDPLRSGVDLFFVVLLAATVGEVTQSPPSPLVVTSGPCCCWSTPVWDVLTPSCSDCCAELRYSWPPDYWLEPPARPPLGPDVWDPVWINRNLDLDHDGDVDLADVLLGQHAYNAASVSQYGGQLP